MAIQLVSVQIKRVLVVLAIIILLATVYFFVYINKPCQDQGYNFNIQGGETESQVNIKVLDGERIARIFKVDRVSSSVGAIQITNCYVYIVRDFSSRVEGDSYRIRYEMWRYDTNGRGKSLMLLLHTNNTSGLKDYSHATAVSHNDKYIALYRFDPIDSQINPEDALIVKKLKNLDDYIDIPLQEIYKKAVISGSLSLLGWSKDSRYLWFSLSEAAVVNAFGRVDIKNKTYDVYAALEGTMGGDTLNVETGWVTYNPESFWCGEITCTEEELSERIAQGRSSTMYIYNLFTDKEYLVISTKEDPLWFYHPKWLSDTELQYTLPSGEKKIFTI